MSVESVTAVTTQNKNKISFHILSVRETMLFTEKLYVSCVCGEFKISKEKKISEARIQFLFKI